MGTYFHDGVGIGFKVFLCSYFHEYESTLDSS